MIRHWGLRGMAAQKLFIMYLFILRGWLTTKMKTNNASGIGRKKTPILFEFFDLVVRLFSYSSILRKNFIIEHFLQNLKSYFNRIFPWWWWWRLIKSYSKEQLLMCFKVVKQTRTCENASTILFCYVLISTGFSNRI